jgi:8-oxo-dGTP diphosphatase
MIQVTAAIVHDEKGRIMICQRPEGKNCALLWEFPGGKQEEGETLEECLARECREELSVDLRVGELYGSVEHDYGTFSVNVHFFLCEILSGSVINKEHKNIKWVDSSELNNYKFCPADTEIIKRLSKNVK